MAASPKVESPSGTFDDLDDLMASLDGPPLGRVPSSSSSASRQPPARPLSLAFPGRAPSRNSSRSRLSTHSSSRSLHSLASAQSSQSGAMGPSSPPAIPSGLAGVRLRQTNESPVSLGNAPSDSQGKGALDEEITPSLAQGEWSYGSPSAPLRSYSRTQQITDDTSSINSGDRPLSPSIRSHPPSPRLSSRRSPSPPRGSNSPLRLIPRSPLKDRTPLEDLAYFEEMDAASSDHWEARAAKTDADSLSVLSSSTGTGSARIRTASTRSQRLREDIERTAERLRASASQEQLERPYLDSRGSESSAGQASPNPNVSSSGVPLYPGAPKPIGYRAGESPELASPNSSPSPHTTPQLASSAASIARSERDQEKRASIRPRQKELREWSQSCLMWQRSDARSGHGGLLGKAPLIREVPGAVKRKMAAKRESSQLLSPAEALLYGMDDHKSRSSSKGKDREKAAGVTMGPNASTKDGSWRKVTSVLRDDGYFRIFSEEKVILHSIHLPSGPRTDIRLVDQSLFDRPNCVVVHRRAHIPFTPFQPSFSANAFSPTSSTSSHSSRIPPTPPPEEPIYLSMPSVVAMETWMVMSHCFAQPEFFVSTGATTPRPMRRGSLATASIAEASSSGHYGGADASEDDDLLNPDSANGASADDTRYRIFRSLTVSVNEGRGIGEAGVEVIRDRPKTSSDSWRDRDSSTSTSGSAYDGLGMEPSPSKSRMPPRTESSSAKDEQLNTFCELILDGVVLARTSVRKGSNNPYWNESFTFNDLPPFLQPLTIRIFQQHRSSRPTLLGVCTVRLPDLPRAEVVDSWWAVRSPGYDARSRSNETVGELSLAVRVGEEVVLPSGEYRPILQLLIDDAEAELPTDLAQEFPSDLEELSKLLLRIYLSEGLILTRIFRLVDLEVSNSTKSAAILFRGNTIVTKSVELYVRRIGREWLDASIGDIVRRLCAEKVEIEIDPSRMKPGVKDKELQSNVHELRDWSLAMWNSIYDARERCPDDTRRIFNHIQKVAEERYGEEQKNTRWTSVSAFVFLRFFVPAVLNPKLFTLVASPPDSKSQRTLTLIAKTLQGLANFAAFGQKEPWMLAMNSFVQENTSAFVDFIEHISTPAGPSASPQEWTSPNAAVYIAPYRLRSSLPPLVREGVPLLPHLVDLPRNLGLLAAHVARGVVEKGPPSLSESRPDSPSITSSRGRSAKFTELAETCIDVHEEARRRGGGLVPPLWAQPREKRSSARPATVRSTNAWARKTTTEAPPPLPTQPSTPPRSSPLTSALEDVMHIRAAPGTPPSSIGAAAGAGLWSPQSEKGSLASRRSHRSYTINGISPSATRRSSGPLHGLSTSEDLTRSPPSLSSPVNGAVPTLPALAGTAENPFEVTGDVFTDNDPFTAPGAEEDEGSPSFSQPAVNSSYSFPSRGSRIPVEVSQSTTTSWAVLPEGDLTPGVAASNDATSLFETSFNMPFSVPMQTTNSSSSWASIPSSTSSRSIIAEVSVGRRPSLPNSTGSNGDLFALGKEGKSKGFFSRRKGSKASLLSIEPSTASESLVGTSSAGLGSDIEPTENEGGSRISKERTEQVFASTGTATASLPLQRRRRLPPHPLSVDTGARSSSERSAIEGDTSTLTAVPLQRSVQPSLGDSDLAEDRHTPAAPDMASSWLADQRARSPLSPPATERRFSNEYATAGSSGPSGSSSSRVNQLPPLLSPPSTRSPPYSSSLASPCQLHGHLDHSLSSFAKRDAAQSSSPGTARRKLKAKTREVAEALSQQGETAVLEDESETASEGDSDDPEAPSLTRQLAETAVSVRQMSKQLGQARVVSHIQSVLIITKARDNHLIRLTRELALWLMQTPRNGKDRGLVVYVDSQLKKSKRFDAEGMERDNPELFRPIPRRYSRTSSSASLAGSSVLEQPLKKMTALSSLTDNLRRSNSTTSDSGRRSREGHSEEGQLRYWTNEMCSKSPHIFDFVVTLGGDGTVLYASWLFQHVVPPIIPFALGSLGFLTNFDFSTYAYTLNSAIDKGIRVNLRMRFTCTVYRAIEGEENKNRKAVKSGKTGGIFMKSLNRDGWEAIENGGEQRCGPKAGPGKDKEVRCFITRPVEHFEVLNEVVVDRGPSPYVSQLELFGDDHHMTTVQADGLTVSTPTGSTAYSLSAGGSLVHPEIPALLITPICPHTLSFRPMLLPDSMELRICVPYNSRSTAWASFDGRGRVELRQGDHIKVTASQYPFPTVCADNQSVDWFHSISRTLKWNERERQKSFVVVEEGHKKSSTSQGSATTTFGTSKSTAHPRPSGLRPQTEGDGSESDDELDDDTEEGEVGGSEDEGFDIDDLSSSAHTNTSSPTNSPDDPTSTVPPLSTHSSVVQQGNPFVSQAVTEKPNAPSHAHSPSPPPSHVYTLRDTLASSAASSVAELNDDNRFHDPAPRPPRLSARHSASAIPLSTTVASSRVPGSSDRRREGRGEGDEESPRETLDVKSSGGAGTSARRNRSREKSPRTPRSDSVEQTSLSHTGGFAFAVVGADDDTSASDS